MADVFISYSKVDRLLVEQLAAYLETEGWSVWWDRSLTAGDAWRDEIATELAKARAAVVVCTQSSITSDFVRAEAGRAKADAKLIPIKAMGVGYRDIPLPFGEMHTEPLENRELIQAAIRIQLAKPQIIPMGIWSATACVRYDVLMWVGIIGVAITLCSNLKGVLVLADWARLLVQHRTDWTQAMWQWPLALLDIKLPPACSPALSFGALAIATIIGGRLSTLSSKLGSPPQRVGFRINPLIPLIASPIMGLVALEYSEFITDWIPLEVRRAHSPLILLVIVVLATSPLIVGFARERVAATACSLLFIPIAYVLMILPLVDVGLDSTGLDVMLVSLGLITGLLPLALTLLPARCAAQRFLFILIGLGILGGLNEMSKLNLGQFLSAAS